jgi:predicted AlkP superfamily pyrophosphatase or phosphodiesterase
MMKKEILILIAVFMLTLLASYSDAENAPKAEHVILIGLDGWGSYSVEKAQIPHIKQLMHEGSYTLKKRSVLPSSSAANWGSMFMGACPELHGYTEWGSKTPELPSRTVNQHGIFPTIFQLYRDANPDAEIGCIYEWDGIKYLVDTLSLSYYALAPGYEKNPTALREMAVQYISKEKPNLFAVIFDNPDHVGHAEGHDTPEYYDKLTELDGYIGQIVNAVKEAGMIEETIFILTADHGGIDKNHGGKTMAEMETPFIISGKNVKQSYCFDHISMMQYDCAAVIAEIFALEQPQVWIGRSMPVFE